MFIRKAISPERLIRLTIRLSVVAIFFLIFAHLTRSAVLKRDLQRVKDLQQIENALIQYYKDHNAFPRTRNQWYSHKSARKNIGPDWIPGLVPEYLETIPADPGGRNTGKRAYIYRSNGLDYKLLANQPENCQLVSFFYPGIQDSKRKTKEGKCQAFGFWTEGAEKW